MSKSATTNAPIADAEMCALREIPTPPRLWVPFEGEARPIGTRVAHGDPISEGSTKYPAPVDGRIVGVGREHVLGGIENSVVILETEPATDSIPVPPASSLVIGEMLNGLSSTDRAVGIDGILARGIRADRWTSPNFAAQLSKAVSSKVHTVICGALDLDPVLPVQRVLATTNAMDIATGAAALGKMVGAARVVLAVPEDMSPAGVEALRRSATQTGVRLFPMLNEYPQGQASLLIRRVTRCRLRPGRLPTDVGVLLIDAPLAVAIGRYFRCGEPMSRVPLGVYDQEREEAHVLSVPIGTKLSHVLGALRISSKGCDLWAGHVLREMAASAEEIIGTGELAVFATKPSRSLGAIPCLRCGWCVETCPARINPAGLLEAAQQEDVQLAADFGLNSCIECGICTHVCPARLPLLQSIRGLRAVPLR